MKSVQSKSDVQQSFYLEPWLQSSGDIQTNLKEESDVKKNILKKARDATLRTENRWYKYT